MTIKSICIAATLALLLALTACSSQPEYPATATPTPLPEPTAFPTATPLMGGEAAEAPAEQPTPTSTPVPPSGPDNYPAGINPLTGLPLGADASLDNPPLVVKVSNSPAVTRPQSGIQSADHVWEHVVEGFALTRFAAVFLGEMPERVGPVRSGRPPDLELVPMYDAIYTASGFSTNHNNDEEPRRMRELMLNAPWRPRNFSAEFGYGDPYNVRFPIEGLAYEHTLFAIPGEMWNLAAEREIGPSDTITPGLAFNPTPPASGIQTNAVALDYPGTGPVAEWRYETESGEWLRWTDGEVHADRLTEDQLHFDNIVILYVLHYETDFVEDEATQLLSVGFNLTGTGDAVLLRDGQRYEITWRRDAQNRFIQFFDASGAVIPFKPGNTWFHPLPVYYQGAEVTFN